MSAKRKKKPLSHEQITRWIYQKAAETSCEYFDENIAASTESPIEKILASHLSLLSIYQIETIYWHTNKESHSRILANLSRIDNHFYSDSVIDGEFHIFPQIQFDRYRADFLIVYRVSDPKLKSGMQISMSIVECDGHDFHEKTKDQARKDKRRDRFFQAKSLPVLRFTGSEIYSDCIQCVNEIHRFLTRSNINPEGYDALDDEDIESLIGDRRAK